MHEMTESVVLRGGTWGISFVDIKLEPVGRAAAASSSPLR